MEKNSPIEHNNPFLAFQSPLKRSVKEGDSEMKTSDSFEPLHFGCNLKENIHTCH